MSKASARGWFWVRFLARWVALKLGVGERTVSKLRNLADKVVAKPNSDGMGVWLISLILLRKTDRETRVQRCNLEGM